MNMEYTRKELIESVVTLNTNHMGLVRLLKESDKKIENAEVLGKLDELTSQVTELLARV